MKQTAGLISCGSFAFVFSIQERRRKSFTEIFRMTPYMFLYIKRQINNQRIVCYYQKSANQTASGCFFAVKYGVPYGGIRDSEQIRRDTIWGYPEYGASNCVHHMVSLGLDGLTF